MSKPDERIKLVMKRDGDTRALVDLIREGDEYHATLSGSASKHTYHASGRKHISSQVNGLKEYREVTYTLPPKKIKGVVELANLTITPAEAWHTDLRHFKKYYGKRVTLLETVDASTLSTDDEIFVCVGIAENRAHVNREAGKIGLHRGYRKPIIKRILVRNDGPAMFLLVYITPRQLAHNNFNPAISRMGNILTIIDPTGTFAPKPHSLCSPPSSSLFPVSLNMPHAIHTVWMDRSGKKDGCIFDIEIRLCPVSGLWNFLAILAMLPKGMASMVTDHDIAVHLASRKTIPLPIGLVIAIDTRFGDRHEQFCLYGQWYQLKVRRSYSKRIEKIVGPVYPTSASEWFDYDRTYFEIELVKLKPNFDSFDIPIISNGVKVLLRRLLQPVQSYQD